MINYWWKVEEVDGQFMVTIKANSDIICITEGFDKEEDADYYADVYVRGFKDGRGEA